MCVLSALSSFLRNWTVIYVTARNWYRDKANFYQTSCQVIFCLLQVLFQGTQQEDSWKQMYLLDNLTLEVWPIAVK